MKMSYLFDKICIKCNKSFQGAHNAKYCSSRCSDKNRKYIKERQAFASIRSRCNNEKNKGYKNYGGLGIKCKISWADFVLFYNTSNKCLLCHNPFDGINSAKSKTIDRIDSKGHYTIENIRLICRSCNTKIAQQNNISKDILYAMYIINKFSMIDISQKLKCSITHVSKYIDYYNIPKRKIFAKTEEWQNNRKNGYTTYSKIKNRCKNSPYYTGIAVKFHSFEEFRSLFFRTNECEKCKIQLNDNNRLSSNGRTVHRINNSGHYEMSNCMILCRSCNVKEENKRKRDRLAQNDNMRKDISTV